MVAASPQILKNAFLSSLLLAHPHSGGGWRAQRDGRGRLHYGPLCGPGSEDSGRHRAPPRAARVRPTERAGSEGSFICCLRRQENHTTALTGEEMQSPFGGWRHHLSTASGGTITRAYCRAIYEESVSRCFILPPEQGEVRRSRIGGRAQRANQQNCFSCHMTYKANPVTLTLCSSLHRAIPQPSARRAVKLKNPPAVRPVHPKNPFPQPFYTTRGASRAPSFPQQKKL